MIFHIAIKDLKILSKDRKALMLLLLMPALIMLILGTALSSYFKDAKRIEKFPVTIVDYDKQKEAATFISVLKNYYKDTFELTENNEKDASDKLKTNKAFAVIIIPQNFTQNILKGKNVKVEVRSNTEESIRSQIVEGTVEGYMNTLSVGIKGYAAFLDVFKLSDNKEFMKNEDAIVMGLMQNLSGDLVQYSETTKKSVSSLQYYAAAMMVMFLLFSSMTGVSMMIEERDNKTLGRIIGAGASKLQLIAGKCLGLVIVGCIQMLILIIFTRIAYGVDWGEPIYGIVIISFCSIFASAGFGMFVAALAKSLKAANGMGSTLIQVFTVLSGGMIPIYLLPSFLKTLSNITPNWQAMDGYYKLMQGVGISQIIPNCIILIAMGLIFLSVGIKKFRIV
ncbi:MAG: ABC transporter permease [Bacillota bacterium]|nr:ABC transporter permease [Bacillota bacterium]